MVLFVEPLILRNLLVRLIGVCLHVWWSQVVFKLRKSAWMWHGKGHPGTITWWCWRRFSALRLSSLSCPEARHQERACCCTHRCPGVLIRSTHTLGRDRTVGGVNWHRYYEQHHTEFLIRTMETDICPVNYVRWLVWLWGWLVWLWGWLHYLSQRDCCCFRYKDEAKHRLCADCIVLLVVFMLAEFDGHSGAVSVTSFRVLWPLTERSGAV